MGMSLVWETTPEMSLTMMNQLLDLMRAVQSWAWTSPGVHVGASEGWRLMFSAEMKVSKSRHFLLLVLSPQPAEPTEVA